jgi:CHAT domain-containing protein
LYLSKCLKGLAQASHKKSLLEEAYSYISRAVAIHDRAQGKDQLELATLLRFKSQIEAEKREWDKAIDTAVRAVEASVAVQEESYQVCSAREAVLLAHAPQVSARWLLSTALGHPQLPDTTLARVFSYLAGTHGMVLDWLAERRRMLNAAEDSVGVEQAWRDFVAATQRVSSLAVGPSRSDESAGEEELAAAYRDKENAERVLAAVSEKLRSTGSAVKPREAASVEALAAALKPGDVLIQFYPYTLRKTPQSKFQRSDRHRYGAFRLEGNAQSWDLSFVDLGQRDSLRSLVSEYRQNIEGVKTGARPSAREEAEYKGVARRLYKKIWGPLFPDRGRASGDSIPAVFVVPFLWLHLLDFNTLLAPTGELVIERHKIHLLSSAGDLLRPEAEAQSGRGLLALGNPTVTSVPSSNESANSSLICAEALLTPQPLPGAAKETEVVAELFSDATDEPVAVLTGPDAKEETIKTLMPGKRVAHLATHGFFCAETKRKDTWEERLADPLLNSGLITSSSDRDDGLLTAQEIVCLDLSGLDWVVLSACGSGLGRIIVTGEGPFGLRRAFEIAGARTVVMSLWGLNDTRLQQTVKRIYENRLAGQSTVDAIRNAQLEQLRDVKKRLNRIHPVLWGGIVAEGDWR